MRLFAWYSPELDTIIIQWIMDECYIGFEWSPFDMHEAQQILGDREIEPSEQFLWVPIGEL